MQKTADWFRGRMPFCWTRKPYDSETPPGADRIGKTGEESGTGSLTLRVMRISTCFLLAAAMSVSVRAASQKITFVGKNVPITSVFTAIQQQTGLSFVYNKNILTAARPVSVSATDMPLGEFLSLVLKGTSLTARVDSGTIVLARRKRYVPEEVLLPEAALDTAPRLLVTGIVRLKESTSEVQPLVGATVSEKGARNAVMTNNRGEFSIRAAAGATLEITHVNIMPITVKVSASQTYFVLEAEPRKATEASDVVVTGYYTRKKESFTGASTTITRKELEKFNNNNIFAVIQSLDPAFQVDENIDQGSNPNQLPQINIRGISSVGSSVNTPLIIIDGFQGTLQQLYDMDINRIESISILKDASATILYGSRAGNGVLVIETRMPKSGKFTITYDLRPSFTLVDLSDYNLMNAREKLEYEKLAGVYTYKGDSDPYWSADYQMKLDNLYRDRLLAVESGVNTYWLSQPVQSVFSTGHSIRAEGGNQEVRYSIDGSYNDYKGVIKESGRKRYGAAFNLIYRKPNKITVRNNASFQSSHEYNSPYGSFSQYARLNPYERIYDENGKLITTYNDMGQFGGDLLGSAVSNPLYNATLPYRDFSNSTQLTNNLSIEWLASRQIKLNLTGVVSKSFSDREKYVSPLNTQFLNETNVANKGSYIVGNGNGFQWQTNANLQYGNTFGRHSLTTNVIGEARASDTRNTSYELTGFVDDRFISPSLALQYRQNSRPSYLNVPERLLGLASNVHYNFDYRYMLDLSYRVDGSSKFGSDNQFGSFWSAGVGYNLHKEKFMNQDFFSMLRLFANVGETGNENFTADMTSTAYSFNSDGYYYLKNSALYASQGNAALTWPKVFQKSAGIDVTFWEKRINARLNVYERVTNRMISAITVAPSLGFAGNRIYENLGEVSNKGFELSSTIMVYSNDKQDLYWSVNFSAVQNKSKLRRISEELRKLNESLVTRDESGNITKTTSYYEENQSLSVFRGVRSLGIDPASGREIYLTADGQRTFNWRATDQVVVGDREPTVRGTFGTDLAYKGLSVRVLFLYNMGGDIYNSTLVSKVENASPYTNADLRVLENRWKNPGDVTNFKGIADQTATQLTSRFVQKENLVRLSSLNINYDFPKEKISRYNLQRLRLNFSTNDMFRISNVRMERGIDYPFARTYNMGLMVQF